MAVRLAGGEKTKHECDSTSKNLRASERASTMLRRFQRGRDLAAVDRTVELYANRFAVERNGRARDLATGQAVKLVESSAGGATEHVRWLARCDAIHALFHPRLAQLVDYGVIGEHRRFEAWTPGAPWSRADEAAFARDPDGPLDRPPRDPAIRLVPRPSLVAIAEALEPTFLRVPTAIGVWGPAGSGIDTAVLSIARIARARGSVPVRTDLARVPEVARAIGGLTLLLIARAAPDWPTFLNIAGASTRPHVLLLTGREEVAGVPCVRLDPVAPADLIEAVRPAVWRSRTVARAARRSFGRPGRFAFLLWGRAWDEGRCERRSERAQAFAAGTRAAEQPAVYDAPLRDPTPPTRARAAWAGMSELASLRRRRDDAEALFARRRHAKAERELRQVAAAQARREAWDDAVKTGLALVEAIARRGRIAEARAALEPVRDWAARAGPAASIDAAIAAGELWLEAARLDEAGAALAAAQSAARAVGDAERVERAVCAGARCDFWLGLHARAVDSLNRILPGASPAAAVRARSILSRCTIGVGEPACALAIALEASQSATKTGAPMLIATALHALAFAHLALDDLEAVDRDCAGCIAAARAANAPLVIARVRLLAGEAARRRGQAQLAAAAVRRARTLTTRAVPPLLAARRDLLADLIAATSPPADVVRRHVQRTRLEALVLFTPSAAVSRPASTANHQVLEELVGILHACHAADDELRALEDVCGRIRRGLDAASVAFAAEERGRVVVVASAGIRADADAAARALAAAAPIAPHRSGDRIEAAVPVAYAGIHVGALTARWSIVAQVPSATLPLLTAAATAAAPVLGAARAARARAAPDATLDIVGVSAATADLRAAVERSATAPFPVLIEGESGSGKELIARAIHRLSGRRGRPFAALNCAALPDDLVEAELFGHAKGAFTGAAAERRGAFEEADGGTLFLDEIGELSPRAQAKILRVIQEGELRRLGEGHPRRIDVRIVAATNRDLRAEVAAGRFRLDLLYRLDVLRISVCPLRERREDIPALADHFWSDVTSRITSRATLAPATVACLTRYDWPGNVRELQNVLASLAVRAPKRGLVLPAALPPALRRDGPMAAESRLDRARQTFEAQFVRAALVRTGGRRAQAAAELGLTRQGLTKLMARLRINS